MVEQLLERVADIVSAHISNNSIAAADVPKLIESVYSSLSSLGKPPATNPESRIPAVPVRGSVKPDALICLDCGAKMKALKRHLRAGHGLTPEEYRARWGLAANYPMVAAEHSGMRQAIAKRIGLGRKPGQTAKRSAKKAVKPK